MKLKHTLVSALFCLMPLAHSMEEKEFFLNFTDYESDIEHENNFLNNIDYEYFENTHDYSTNKDLSEYDLDSEGNFLNDIECFSDEDEYVNVCGKSHIKPLRLDKFDEDKSIKETRNLNKDRLIIYKDDVTFDVFNTHEKKITKEYVEKVVKQHGAVRKFYRYWLSDENKNTEDRILYIVIPGTWASENENYWNPDTKMFSMFLYELGKEAKDHAMDIDVICFQWSGENNNDDRINAGKNLGHLINRIKKWYKEINFKGHSHGCSVIASATNELIDCIIESAVFIAAPVVEEKHWRYMPNKINKLYNFYSWFDLVQWLGSWNLLNNPTCKYDLKDKDIICKKHYNDGRRFNNKYIKGHVYNILFAMDGDYPGHSEMTMKILESNPYEIIKRVEKNYNGINDISINIVPKEKCVQFSVKPINITLHPEVDLKTVDEKTLNKHKKYFIQHKKVYSYLKDNVSQIYTIYALIKKLFW